MDKKKYMRPQLETFTIEEQLMQYNASGAKEILSREKGTVNDEEDAKDNWE